jgi:uncharacterized protein
MSSVFAQKMVLFAIYAFAGWLLETSYASIRERRFVNRGFLCGPFCPIYGFGALLIIAVTEQAGARLDDPLGRGLVIILMSALLVTWMEYATGWVLDRIFHRKWWDYQGRKMNIGGYVCVEFSLLWGALAFVLAELIHPAILLLLTSLPGWFLIAAAWIILIDFIIDTGVSVSREWQRKHSSGVPRYKLR